MNKVITIDEDKGVCVSNEITIDKMTKPKQKQNSSKDKNLDRILTKVKGEASQKRQSAALEESVRLMDFADRISKKLTRNHNHIKIELVSNPDFEKPLNIQTILAQVHKTLHKDEKPVANTTLFRYHKIGKMCGRPIKQIFIYVLPAGRCTEVT